MVCADASEGMDLAVRVRASRQRAFFLYRLLAGGVAQITGEFSHLEVPNPNPVI